jgi:hypothetical protein
MAFLIVHAVNMISYKAFFISENPMISITCKYTTSLIEHATNMISYKAFFISEKSIISITWRF